MNIVKRTIAMGIWFNGFLWQAVDIISPNKFQDFILVKRDADTIEDDEKTVTVEMELIDCGNDAFYPNVPFIAQIMNRRAAEDEKRHDEEYGNGMDSDSMTSIYLSMFKDE